jgi:SWI/SNF-related matrix-associated actin-dependent regulator of chromatin subfamily A-like protein 1
MPALKSYQLEGAVWLAARKRAYLADEMRLGKSVQTVLAMSLAGSYDSGKMNLIVAPASAVYDWPVAFRTWSPETPSVAYATLGTIAKGPLDFRYHRYDVVVMSYECLAGAIDWLGQFSFDTVVFDEAHYLKTPDTRRAKAAFGRDGTKTKPKIVGASQLADRVWCLSGTPMPNHAGELWTVCRHLWPEAIINEKTGGPMNQNEFEARYVRKTMRKEFVHIVGSKNLPDLRKRIRPYFKRRTLAQVAPEIDPLSFQMLPVIIRPAEPEIQVEADALRDALAKARNDEERVAIIIKAAQFEHLRSHLAVYKALEISRRISDECFPNKSMKQVVVGWHTDALKLIWRHCKEAHLAPLYIDGSTPAAERGKLAKQFREIEKHRVMCLQLKAGGTGIDLSCAHVLTFNDMSYTPGDNIQAAFRIMKVTDTTPKAVRIAYAQDTIDKDVSEILMRKIRDQVQLFEAGSEVGLAGALDSAKGL